MLRPRRGLPKPTKGFRNRSGEVGRVTPVTAALNGKKQSFFSEKPYNRLYLVIITYIHLPAACYPPPGSWQRADGHSVGSTRAARVICDAPVANVRNVRREGASNCIRGRMRSPKRYVKERGDGHGVRGCTRRHFTRCSAKTLVRHYRNRMR